VRAISIAQQPPHALGKRKGDAYPCPRIQHLHAGSANEQNHVARRRRLAEQLTGEPAARRQRQLFLLGQRHCARPHAERALPRAKPADKRAPSECCVLPMRPLAGRRRRTLRRATDSRFARLAALLVRRLTEMGGGPNVPDAERDAVPLPLLLNPPAAVSRSTLVRFLCV